MKKVLAVLLSLAMAIGLCACGSSTTTETTASTDAATESTEAAVTGQYTADELKGALIYVITDTQQNSYFVAEGEGAKAAAEALGFTVKVVSYESDINKETELCDAAISEGAVGIVWDVADSDASITSVQKAKDAGIVTACTSRELNTTGVAIAQLVADNAGGSKAIAEKFVEAMGETGKYAELYGMDGDNNSKVRSEGYHSVIDQYTDMECVTVENSNFDLTESYNDTESILQTYPEITGIITANDTEALGAYQACVDAGREDVIVIGNDGSDEVVASVKEGGILGTALQPCVLETQMAVQQIYDYLTTGTTGCEEKQIIDSPAITKDNADKVSGFYMSE